MIRFKTPGNTGSALRLMTAALFIGSLLGACKKTEIVPYEREAQNHIVEFMVTNVEESLYGVVDNMDNTITVYIPYYLNTNFIIPKIRLDEGAKLIDAAGNEIDIREDMEPVHVDSTGYTYTVKDAKEVLRTYTLISKIVPYKDALKLGYALTQDANNNYIADEAAESEALVNQSITIYGNFESSSKNGKATLINNSTNAAVAGGLQIVNVARAQLFHYMTLQISPDIDSGYYHIVIEHQGRKDTLPTIHLSFQKPQFEWLAKTWAAGDTVTLNVIANGGVNTGIKRGYAQLSSVHYNFPGAGVPAGFPPSLMDTPIELEIAGQSRTQIKFKFPNVPVGIYNQYISGGPGNVTATGFGFFFDFNSPEWGNNQLLSSAPYVMEVIAKP